jgi:hypothetical protein
MASKSATASADPVRIEGEEFSIEHEVTPREANALDDLWELVYCTLGENLFHASTKCNDSRRI